MHYSLYPEKVLILEKVERKDKNGVIGFKVDRLCYNGNGATIGRAEKPGYDRSSWLKPFWLLKADHDLMAVSLSN